MTLKRGTSSFQASSRLSAPWPHSGPLIFDTAHISILSAICAMKKALLAVLVLAVLSAKAIAADEFAAERQQMIEQINASLASISSAIGIEKLDPRVLAVMAEVPRHEFVPADQVVHAYKDRPLPIGHGQTISAPFIVAVMTDLLRVTDTDTVLEVGTGSGYQSAVLSRLAKKVYTIEILPELGLAARSVLERLGYDNVETKIGDGYQGWPEHAPFDAIIVTAAPDHIPPALIEQLKPNGRLVIPVGDLVQDLLVVTKNADGTTTEDRIVPVRFVPFLRN